MSKQAKYFYQLLTIHDEAFLIIMDWYQKHPARFVGYKRDAIQALLAMSED